MNSDFAFLAGRDFSKPSNPSIRDLAIPTKEGYMSNLQPGVPVTRRRALAVGAGITGSLLASTSFIESFASAQGTESMSASAGWQDTVDKIEEIIQAQGMMSNGVLSIEIDRNDITDVTLHGVPIKPAFQVNGTLYFQDLGRGRVAMNSDMALKGNEINGFIDQLLTHGIVFQAEHQHFYDFTPIVWFIHFRAAGQPLEIAKGIKAALNVTSTPFPQTSPSNPTTPLPAEELGDILGASPSVGADGVVTFDLPRLQPITLGDIRVSPYLNVQTSVVFQPYGGGNNAAAAPDFGLIASEVDPVVRVMRKQGWDIGCLYNQETDEYPQEYFSHQFKTGNSIELAREIRRGLDLMHLKFMS
jgi:hypothetical protein